MSCLMPTVTRRARDPSDASPSSWKVRTSWSDSRKALSTATDDLGFLRLGKEAFLACPSEAIDRAVMEKTSAAAVIPAEFEWSDVGSWGALWDIAEKDEHTVDRMTKEIRERWPFISYAPVLFVSALTGQRTPKVFEAVDAVVEQARQKIATPRLNDFLKEFQSMRSPQSYRGREVKFYYITQVGASPPAFMVFTNYPDGIKDHYKRFLVNSLRESLGLDICPIIVVFKKRE